jgi:hypothetical protein
MGSTSKYQKIYEPGQSEPGHRHMEVNNSVEKTFSIEASARGHYPPNSEVVIIITAPSVFIEIIGVRLKFYINLMYCMYVQCYDLPVEVIHRSNFWLSLFLV